MRFWLDWDNFPEEEFVDELVEGVMMPLEDLAAVTARDTLLFAVGYSGALVLADGSGRPRHNSYMGPPGWADKTGTLVTRYGSEIVRKSRTTIEFVFWNDAPHASLVEAMPAGYQVVQGLNHYFVDLWEARVRARG